MTFQSKTLYMLIVLKKKRKCKIGKIYLMKLHKRAQEKVKKQLHLMLISRNINCSKNGNVRHTITQC